MIRTNKSKLYLTMYCTVSTFSKTFDEIWLTYFVPDFLKWELKRWQLVQLPIKEKLEYAIVLETFFSCDSEVFINLTNSWLLLKSIKIDKDKIKSLIKIKNYNILLKSWQLKLITWISKNYFTVIHNGLNLMIPKNIREKLLKDKLELEKTKKLDYKYDNKKALSIKQKEVYEKIKESKNLSILLYWVTWSWKTEIYVRLIKDNLDSWKQALLLIPEIILWNQIWDKIKKIFWEEVIIVNSSITSGEKTKYWIDIHSGNAKIIVWTRSALFYPYENLWLIIVDEEHDNSYISDSSPRYKTKEVVMEIWKILKIKTILASWTPSIKTMYEAIKGKYELVNLLEKWNKSNI